MSAPCAVAGVDAVRPADFAIPNSPGTSGQSTDPLPDGVPTLGGADRTSARESDVDRQLLREIVTEDREAFRRLYLRYHPRLVRFLARILRRTEDTEDVANETMLIIWQQAGSFRGGSLVSTWIFGIAYRCALKSIRRSALLERTAMHEVESRPLVTDDASRATEDRQIVELGLAMLSPEQRLVLVLAYEMDCSCEEIAAIVDSPVNTVKTRMFYARRKLRAVLTTVGARQAGGRADTESLLGSGDRRRRVTAASSQAVAART